MLMVRPVAEKDIDDLLELALKAGKGMTSLPHNREALTSKIQLSMDSFERTEKHRDDFFLLAMEDTERDKVVGTAGIYAMTGAQQAFYAYRLMSVTHHSHSLQKQVRSELLHLSNDYTDCSEVGSFFLDPEYRGNGHWLGKARYILMGLFPDRFADSVIAELRGWTDEDGHSPFWDAIGHHFFQMSFDEADRLCGVGSNQFITELMPKYPIYTNLLPEAAKAVIGKPADAGRRAKQLLEEEGFHYERLVDVFDAGPIMRADIQRLRSIQALQTAPLTQSAESKLTAAESKKAILCNPTWHHFRVTQDAWVENNNVHTTENVSQLIGLAHGQTSAFLVQEKTT